MSNEGYSSYFDKLFKDGDSVKVEVNLGSIQETLKKYSGHKRSYEQTIFEENINESQPGTEDKKGKIEKMMDPSNLEDYLDPDLRDKVFESCSKYIKQAKEYYSQKNSNVEPTATDLFAAVINLMAEDGKTTIDDKTAKHVAKKVGFQNIPQEMIDNAVKTHKETKLKKESKEVKEAFGQPVSSTGSHPSPTGYTVIATGISDQQVAQGLAQQKGGKVVTDADDPAKFMIILAENTISPELQQAIDLVNTAVDEGKLDEKDGVLKFKIKVKAKIPIDGEDIKGKADDGDDDKDDKKSKKDDEKTAKKTVKEAKDPVNAYVAALKNTVNNMTNFHSSDDLDQAIEYAELAANQALDVVDTFKKAKATKGAVDGIKNGDKLDTNPALHKKVTGDAPQPTAAVAADLVSAPPAGDQSENMPVADGKQPVDGKIRGVIKKEAVTEASFAIGISSPQSMGAIGHPEAAVKEEKVEETVDCDTCKGVEYNCTCGKLRKMTQDQAEKVGTNEGKMPEKPAEMDPKYNDTLKESVCPKCKKIMKECSCAKSEGKIADMMNANNIEAYVDPNLNDKIFDSKIMELAEKTFLIIKLEEKKSLTEKERAFIKSVKETDLDEATRIKVKEAFNSKFAKMLTKKKTAKKKK